MPKAVKKTKPVTAKSEGRSVKKVMPAENLDMDMVSTSSGVMESVSTKKPMLSGKTISLILIAAVVGFITYKAGPWLVPAIAGSTPVTRFELWSRLEKSYGTQALEDMVNEKILDKAIANAGIKVDQAKLDAQIKALETQFESTGGLDEALKQRGLTRKDLEKQVKTQLAVEELLADKITPTEAEVKKVFDDGASTMYKDKKFEEVKASITDELKQAKLRDSFLAWFADIKKTVKVRNFGL